MQFSAQQEAAIKAVRQWVFYGEKPFFYLAGYAGTGKSTIAKFIAEDVCSGRDRVAYAAFTGKAARVMASKGCDGAQTIHSLIYHVRRTPDGKLETKRKSKAELASYKLIIIDECSMVDEDLGRDLLSFRIPVLVLGDPAQLPPISGAGFFTSGEPDVLLTEIHRQAAESPILMLATDIRSGTFKPQRVSCDGLEMGRKSEIDPVIIRGSDALICGRNDTRRNLNAWRRKELGHSGPRPAKGETLICLKNDKELGISNGQLFVAEDVKLSRKDNKAFHISVSDEIDGAETGIDVLVPSDFFVDDTKAAQNPEYRRGVQHFTFGYAMTAHKSQGSQWNNVCVFDESFIFSSDASRWLYTAVTRSAEHVTLVFKD